MVLFQVGQLDITPFIVLNSYKVSSQPLFETWTDGDCLERRGVKRRKLKGTFNVKFFSANDFSSFLDAVEAARTSGDYITATVYDVKAKAISENISVFFDYEPVNVLPSAGLSDTEEIEITITQR